MKNTTKIVIHSRQQEIGDIYLYRDPDRQINIIPTTSKYNETLEFLEISTTEILISGKEYLISIDYKGKLRDDNLGFYRSSYINEDDERVWLAATQFEETEARHAFPCYDEPQIRTPFKILIEHHKSYEAISNWPKESEMELGGSENVMTIFEETDPIQTYLVAFIISNFDNLTSNDSKPIQRVFAKPSSIKKDEAESALLDGVKLLAKFEEYFNVSYRPPKMDQVALPDFDAGAMENYALVTYREEYLLLNNESTSREKKNVLTTISHEFAHQWFGDYVNPVWWSYLWLNEGFATFYEYFMASLVYPDIRLMDEFVIDVVQNALEVDANQYIRPMTFYVEKPNEIDDLFDRIAYDKSGSVLRMFQNALGEKIWSKGLTNYLNTMKMSAASSDDLYKGIQTSIDYEIPTSNINISTIMKTWENQAGFPLITVSREGKMLKFTQERFYNENSNTTSSNDTWWIPINFASDLNADFIQLEPEFWMFEKSYLFELSENDSKSWIIVNKQQGFYYRVNYDETLWNLIINQLNGKDHKEIHILNRAQLIDDSLNLAKAGKISYSIPLEILSYLQNETDYIPWAAVSKY
jgi:aminopeptidase N